MRGYGFGRAAVVPAEAYVVSKHAIPGAVAWVADEATRRLEEKAQAADNRRIDAARDQDVREEEEAKRAEEEAKRQKRRDLYETLGTIGAASAAAAVVLRWLGG